MIIIVTDEHGIPYSKRSGAAVFRTRGAFTSWLKYGSGQQTRLSAIVRIHVTGEAWQGTLGQYLLQNVKLFGK